MPSLTEERVARQCFYDTVTESQKAEFINGEVLVHSPVRMAHTRAGKLILHLLHAHVTEHRLGFVGYEKVMVSLTRNDYEPDVCFFRREQADGFDPDQMHYPAPDLVVEVLSPSTEANDRGIKFDDYAAHGIEEYWIVDAVAETVEQYLLDGPAYRLEHKSTDGVLHSRAVPGFEMPVRACFDDAANAAALRRLLDAPGVG